MTYPCQDGGDILCMNKTENSTNNNHTDNDCHTCPPFCVCNCCHVNTIIALNESVNAITPIPVVVTYIYNVISLKDIILDIWQPPKA